jgi:hypothetical protein
VGYVLQQAFGFGFWALKELLVSDEFKIVVDMMSS